ncbi:MAG: hypothetical protein JO199_06995 [Candidatus Eremiobacteraeota bacterium]|nr:hypothetical protein [Candidatus Eremiobacteraeota bacterium]
MPIARSLVAAFAAAIALATLAPAQAATPSPAPKGSAHPVAIPTPHLPTHKLHAEYVVEVNKKGQVVKVKSGVATNVPAFNTETYGNALQMWIRHQDGTATVGLFKVTYDYDPATQKVARNVTLISAGGTWGDEEGAANKMIDDAKKQAAADAASQAEAEAKARKNLPSLNQITGQPTPKPSPTPTL